jgi:hypothetical protein
MRDSERFVSNLPLSSCHRIGTHKIGILSSTSVITQYNKGFGFVVKRQIGELKYLQELSLQTVFRFPDSCKA